MKKKIIARCFIKKECVEAFKAQAAALIPKTRSEEGCLFYSLFQDVSSPGEFLFYEEYRDQAAVDAHLKSEYLGRHRANTKQMQSKETIVDII
ncbi:MAG: antibiotic biosynthesis monooxygenase [Candidatus Omnitrophica bacterium]|nr:antibiotic biosynthesis monooxygenase [Candidatus Omnitrophota bacterium]